MALYENLKKEIVDENETETKTVEKKEDNIFTEAEGCYLLKFETPETDETVVGVFEVYNTEVNTERKMVGYDAKLYILDKDAMANEEKCWELKTEMRRALGFDPLEYRIIKTKEEVQECMLEVMRFGLEGRGIEFIQPIEKMNEEDVETFRKDIKEDDPYDTAMRILRAAYDEYEKDTENDRDW